MKEFTDKMLQRFLKYVTFDTESVDENTTAWDAVKKTSQCELKPKQRYTTLQALEQTLNKIFLLNNSVTVTSP